MVVCIWSLPPEQNNMLNGLSLDSSIRQVGTQRWLHKLSSRRHRRQLFGTLQTINGLRAVSVGSIRAFAEAAEFDFHAPPCKRLLVAARGSPSSRPHVGCTQGIHMVGSFGVAYSTHVARINLARMMPLRYGEVWWPRRWLVLQRRCLDCL